ncbi:MAG TPA: nucleotide exchange factor GrpE [Candidatus Saccharimonadales bacterium]|nr:nucleotide exchange factor GrpE [Candidatus Saccharimonadales bacterium]
MTKKSKEDAKQQQIDELTADLQRIRADFENYRKRIESEKKGVAELAKAATVMKLLPVVDTIERAIAHTPDDIADHKWVQGVTSMAKNLEKGLKELDLSRIEATPGTPFDPNLHEAVMMEDGEGATEIIAEELRAGYKMGEQVVRPSMVKVTRGELGQN